MPDRLAEDETESIAPAIGTMTILAGNVINSLESGANSYDSSSNAVNFGPSRKRGTHSERRGGISTRCLTRKPLDVVHAEEEEGVLERTLGFWDLFALGFGGTVGSGVFVMTGLICHELAGPAGMFSWIIAGLGCLLSGVSFAELSWRVPSAGGAYAYTFVALGELPAAIVGWCMTLEYGISAAAVAKSWGEMLSVLVGTGGGAGEGGGGIDDGSTSAGVGNGPQGESTSGFGPWGVLDMGGLYAAALQAGCVLIVVGGLKASKITVNVFCLAKGFLVVFMTVMAFTLYKSENLVPLAPFGADGVLKGSVAAFFGYLGFDEVVLLSPEAKNPSKHVPRALFASLVGVTAVCALASLSLSGALPAKDLDPDSAFAEAFRSRGMMIAYNVTAIGELVTLPLVVLVSFMAQPRLLFAMAKDGLLPQLFAEVDSRGTLRNGSLASGAVCVLIAACVPFDALDSVISAGVLFAFNFVTSSLLILRSSACLARSRSPNASPRHGDPLALKNAEGEGVVRVLFANLAAFASAGLGVLAGSVGAGEVLSLLGSVTAAVIGLYVLSGLKARPSEHLDISEGNYLAPFFPWVQGGALWVNWFLVCQLPLSGLVALGSYVGFAVAHYACYGMFHSVGNCSGWSTVLSSAASKLTIVSNGRSNSNQYSSLATMDPEGLGDVTTEDGVASPLLGNGGSGDDVGGATGQQQFMIDGVAAHQTVLVSDRQPASAPGGDGGGGEGVVVMGPPTLVRRRSMEGSFR